MQDLNKNINKSKFSNYGTSIFAKKTQNTQFFANANKKRPTFRGAFPKKTKWSLNNEGILNANNNFNRAIEFNESANKAKMKAEQRAASAFGVSSKLSAGISTEKRKVNPSRLSNISFFTGKKISDSDAFDGNAARSLQPEIQTHELPEYIYRNNKNKDLRAIKGQQKQRGIMQSSVLSPMLITVAKFSTAIILVVACAAFARVGLSSATVSLGINSQEISSQIESELAMKNTLEVQDSTLGNSSRLRDKAAEYGLVAPTSIEQITLAPDPLCYDNDGNVSLTESLNRVANSTK